MKLSCTNSMVNAPSLTEKAKLLKSWGYEGISVFINYGDWNEALKDEVMQLRDKTGIAICEFAFEGAPYGHGHLMDPDPAVRQMARAMYTEAAGICAKLGAVTEIEFEYQAQYPIPMMNPYAKMPPDVEAEFIEMYRGVAAPVQGTDGAVLIEPINRYESPYLNTLGDSVDVVKKLGLPNTGILADVFHMSIEELSIAASLEKYAPYIRHVHLGDHNRLLPGRGNIDWAACIGVLKKAGYTGYLNLECCTCGDPAQTLPETAEFLRKLL